MIERIPRPPGRLAMAVKSVWDIPGNAWRALLRAAPMQHWWRAGAAVALTVVFAGIIGIFWLAAFWPPEAWPLRGNWLGYLGMAAAFLLLICIVALMDFRLNFRASRAGIEANMAGEHDEAPVPLTVATTTTTTVTPPGATTAAPEPAPPAAPSVPEAPAWNPGS